MRSLVASTRPGCEQWRTDCSEEGGAEHIRTYVAEHWKSEFNSKDD